MILPALLLAAPVGAVAGSFAATAGLRWARGEQAVSGRSRCDGCGMALDFGLTVPVISYVALRGACAQCRAPIASAHLAGEISGAVIATLAVATLPLPQALAVAALGLFLIGSACADSACRRLPDLATLGVAGLGAGLAFCRSPEALIAGVAAAFLTALVLMSVRAAFQARRGDPGLGLGDVKLAAALAIWLGAATPWAITLAGIIGLAQASKVPAGRRVIAFGPALAIGGWLVGWGLQSHGLGDLMP